MSDDTLGQPDTIRLYRDRFTDAQRRRVEALVLVHRMWPLLLPDSCLKVAQWVYRGEARVREVSRG